MTSAGWLVKQEPESYSWNDFVKEGRAAWTGIRSYPARLHLRAMKKGDLVFFYHSVTEKQVVGLARVEREAYVDPTAEEGDWSSVDLVPLKSLKKPVSLEAIRNDKVLSAMWLIKQSRLSVSPVTAEQCARLLALAETKVDSSTISVGAKVR